MDYITLVITTSITALVGAVVGAAVTTIVTMAKDKKRGHDDANEALKDGMKLLLMDKATSITKAAVIDGEITMEDRVKVHNLTNTARALGANGESHECDRLVDELPTKHE